MCERASLTVQASRVQGAALGTTAKSFSRLLLMLAVLMCATDLMPAAGAVPSVRFGPATNFLASADTYQINAILAADLNHDGKPDIVVAGHSGSSVVLGLGGGAFSALSYFSRAYYAIAVGDFNNDGNVDLVAADDYNTVSSFLGDGRGNLSLFTNYDGLVEYSKAVAVGDFNGDGKADIAILNDINTLYSVKVLLGRGDGSFGVATSYALPGQPFDMCVGDLNGDGKPDVVITLWGYGNSLCVLLNNGDGTFAAPKYYGSGNSSSLALGDFNGDGRLDVAAKSYNASSLMVFLNNGTGAFSSTNSIPVGLNFAGIATGDFNADGKVDLILRYDSTAKVLIGNGDGSFIVSANFSVINDGKTHTVAVGDFDGDGLPDLAISGTHYVSIMLNKSQPVLQITPQPGYNQISWPAALGSFTVEYTTNLSVPGSWQLFPYPPVVLGSQKGATDWATGEQKFYRLRKP